MELVDITQLPHSLSPALKRVCDWLAEHDLAAMENGMHEIDGEDFYVNIFAYTTQDDSERIWEAHRVYADVHVIIEGQETVQQAFLRECQCKDYEASKDYVPIEQATARTRFILSPDFLAVFYPEDVHQTGLKVNGHAAPLRKAVFKWRLS